LRRVGFEQGYVAHYLDLVGDFAYLQREVQTEGLIDVQLYVVCVTGRKPACFTVTS